MSGGQELPGGQAAAEPLPVLPLPEVPGRGHGQGGERERDVIRIDQLLINFISRVRESSNKNDSINN